MNDNSTQIGIFNLPGNMAFPKDKVLQIFTKLKRKAKSQSPAAPGGESTPIRDLEPNLHDLQVSAMNSYRIGPEVVKTENGFEIE